MTKRFNIQLNIQRVVLVESKPGYGHRGEAPVKKDTSHVLELKVTADSEAEAFDKIQRLLNASKPEPEVHLHRASCDDSGGNLVCGFPPGKTIAS